MEKRTSQYLWTFRLNRNRSDVKVLIKKIIIGTIFASFFVEKATSVDFSLLEYTLLQEREPPKPKLSRKIGYKSILKGSTNKNTNQPISSK